MCGRVFAEVDFAKVYFAEVYFAELYFAEVYICEMCPTQIFLIHRIHPIQSNLSEFAREKKAGTGFLGSRFFPTMDPSD